MSLIDVAAVSKRYGADLILDTVTFRIERGDKVALVGANGAGKSTMLRIIAGLEEPDDGAVHRARHVRVAYLPQTPDFEATDTLYDVMLVPFRDAIQAQERLRGLEREMAHGRNDPVLIEEYGQVQAVVEHAGYDHRQQIERVLLGLNLNRELWDLQVAALSGGQRTRANLARTLLRNADVLLLDEPTNHLDIPAVEWLESYLRDLKRAFLIVAHDRYLLDRVTRRTLELSSQHITEYEAPYSRYLELRADRLERQRLEYAAQQRHIVKTEEFVRRYGAGQRYKEARGRQKQLDRLERVERPEDGRSVKLRMSKPDRTGDVVLEVRGLIAGYPDHALVQLPEQVIVRRGEKIAIVGPNGAGKTTLLRTLVGALPSLAGERRWGSRVSIGYYSQTLAQLDEDRTVLEEIKGAWSGSDGEARTFLARFLFVGDDVDKKVAVLSGGERSRVALAKLILQQPNVLVLDEPTNHLDIESRDALEQVLHDFAGTLLFASHDRYLIDSLVDHIWLIQGGRLSRYDGNYSSYAEGSARSLDWIEPRSRDRSPGPTTPAERVWELADEAESLAGQLSEAARTTSVTHLADMTERYEEIAQRLEEAQAAWVKVVREKLRSSSG